MHPCSLDAPAPGLLPGSSPLFLSLRALAGFLAILCYFFTLKRLNLATAILLNYSSPIFVMLMAIPFLKEKVSWAIVVPFLLSFSGILCLALPELRFRALPFAAGLVAGLLAAVAYVTISYLGRFENPLTVVYYFTAWSVAGSLLLCYARFRMPAAPDLPSLIGAGLFGLAGQWGMTQAYFYGPASLISVFSLTTPLFGYLLGLLLWHETLTPLSVVGMLLILVGCAILSIKYHKTRGV